ncbi:MAG: hypothetical protein FJ361_10145, partial [Gemmatimonadetes bacterium]|nr:hypothetical protein [Gemmatimonadota bacterium]
MLATFILALYAGVASAGNVYYETAQSGNTDKIYALDCSLAGSPSVFTTLDGDPGSSRSAGLASDGTNLYYYNFTAGASSKPYISRKPIAGGSAVRITGGGGESGTLGVNDFILTMVGSDLYAQHMDWMYKIPSAATETAKVNTDPLPVSADISGSGPGGATPAVIYLSTGGFYWLKSSSNGSSPWLISGIPPLFDSSRPTFTPTGDGTAPKPFYAGSFAGNSTTLYEAVFGSLGDYVATYTFSSNTWNQTALRYPNTPANDGANTSSPSTHGFGPSNLLSTSDGSIFYLTTNTLDGANNGLLYGYSARSQAFALLKDLGTTNAIRRGAAIDPSCSFDATKVIPTLKSWETGDKPTFSPSATFSFREGTAYTLNPGAWTESTGVNTYAYEWQQSATSSCLSTYTAISGAITASYTPASGDAGKCLRVKVTPTSANGIAGVPVYAGGVRVAAGPPSNTVAPVISESSCTATITSAGTWTGSPSYMYFWMYYSTASDANADTSGTPGSSSSTTWTLSSTQNTKYIRGFVRAENTAGATTVGSNVVGPISGCTGGGGGGGPANGGGGGGPANSAITRPVVTQSGCTLSVSNGTWTGGVSGYSYTWTRFAASTRTPDGPPIATTQTYTLAASDIGKYFAGQVQVVGSGGAGSSASLLYGPVTACDGSSPAAPASTGSDSTAGGKPAPGPALSVKSIPAEITLDLGSSTSSDGTIPPDQPITAEVPCNAPEGQLLDRCTVNVTAPEYVLLGQGD